MKRICLPIMLTTLTLSLYSTAPAQPPRGKQTPQPGSPAQSTPMAGKRGGRGGAAMLPNGGPGHAAGGAQTNLLFMALDTNQDGQLSGAELSRAASVLRALDTNQDGQLSASECAKAAGGHGHGGGSAPNPQEQATENVEVLMAFDKNHDQMLTAEELPASLQSLMERADYDRDGKITKLELTKLAQQTATPATSPAGFPPRRGDPQPAIPSKK